MKYKNVIIVGDFNCDFSKRQGDNILSVMGQRLQKTLLQFSYTVTNKEPTRVTGDSSTLIDLVIASKETLIRNTRTLELGISVHRLIYGCLCTKIKRPPPKIVKGRTFKNFNRFEFIRDVENAPWSVCSVFDDPDDNYWAWSTIFSDICDRHAPKRQVKIRSQSLPWVTPQVRHLMNLRYKTLLKAQKTKNEELWFQYRGLRNRVTDEVRRAKCAYYSDLFEQVKDSKSYWKLIKNATCFNSSKPLMAIRSPDGVLETADQRKADILNEHFSSIGETLASELPSICVDMNTYITRVTPTITHINLTSDVVKKALLKLKLGKASGPDEVTPKLLKLAGNAIIPSLLTVFISSATSNKVPLMWKSANVSSVYKSKDETDKLNYRPISLLCVPGKIMESCVATTITSHVSKHDLGNYNKKGHSTEHLLIRMTEDWRQSLDNNLVVGVVFVDFRKAFDTVSHSLLLKKLQGLGITGDLWSWIRDYLNNRSQVTIVNGCPSERKMVKYGVPQGSVLGPMLFSLFCNDLPDVTEGEGVLQMYADDTTIYVSAPSHDKVAEKLNHILERLYEWCCKN